MATPKIGKNEEGDLMHYSVGALIEKEGHYLLIDRVKSPFGFAGLAGHIDEGETPEEALYREVKEEAAVEVVSQKLIFDEEVKNNVCSKGVRIHYWYLFHCDIEGDIVIESSEAKTSGWYTRQEIKKLPLEPVWQYWFKKLNIL